MISEKLNYLKPTRIFLIVGFFIPGFTAIGILRLQTIISSFGVECSEAWNIIWTLTTIGTILLPIIFIKYIQKATDRNGIKSRLTVFNVIEYTLIQGSLAQFFTNGKTLCYISDGQNGLEFAFTGWLALPIIFLLSLTFNRLQKVSETVIE